MKFVCRKTNLQKGLILVSRLVSQRTTLPVLGNVLITASEGKLEIAATDLEAAIRVDVSAKIIEKGAITIPTRTLTDFISTVSDDELTVEATEVDATIKTAHYSADFKGIASSEFPIIPKIEKPKSFMMRSQDLKIALSKVLFAAALDETRPVLAGVYIIADNEKLTLVSTDSYRLAEKTQSISSLDEKFALVAPARTLAELQRILPEIDEEVKVSAGDSQMEFEFAGTMFMTRLIEGAFPDYQQIIPKKFECEFVANKSEFIEALKIASIFARESSNNIKLAVGKDEITLKATSAGVGQAEAKLKAQISGSMIEVSFNGKYILDALLNISGQRAGIGLSGKLSAGLVSSKDEKDYRYIIMPLRNE